MKLSLRVYAHFVGFLILLGSVHAAADWTQMRAGLTSAETSRILGQPLLRLKGRGVERWIYDGSGEVVFYDGPVRFWTPATPSAESAAKPVESDVMFRPARAQRLLPVQTPAPVASEPAVSDSPRFRYR